MNHQKLFGVKIDAINMREAVNTVRSWAQSNPEQCRYVVTPNVDHAVLLQSHDGLKKAYRDADLVLADGHPIIWASKILGRPLPERVPGSDLVPKLFKSLSGEQPLSIFLLGAAPGVAANAAMNIHATYPGAKVVGVYSPPIGFEKDENEIELILGRIALAQPDVLVVGLGAPKQECWVHENRDRIRAKVALCVGATIDFLAGEKKRAPVWMQRSGIEWLHRMMSEPKRLVKRYAKDAWIFPQLVVKQWFRQRAV